MLPPSKRFKMENSLPVHQNGVETPRTGTTSPWRARWQHWRPGSDLMSSLLHRWIPENPNNPWNVCNLCVHPHFFIVWDVCGVWNQHDQFHTCDLWVCGGFFESTKLLSETLFGLRLSTDDPRSIEINYQYRVWFQVSRSSFLSWPGIIWRWVLLVSLKHEKWLKLLPPEITEDFFIYKPTFVRLWTTILVA